MLRQGQSLVNLNEGSISKVKSVVIANAVSHHGGQHVLCPNCKMLAQHNLLCKSWGHAKWQHWNSSCSQRCQVMLSGHILLIRWLIVLGALWNRQRQETISVWEHENGMVGYWKRDVGLMSKYAMLLPVKGNMFRQASDLHQGKYMTWPVLYGYLCESRKNKCGNVILQLVPMFTALFARQDISTSMFTNIFLSRKHGL